MEFLKMAPPLCGYSSRRFETRGRERVNELESGIIPLLEKEGWMRDQENVAKQP